MAAALTAPLTDLSLVLPQATLPTIPAKGGTFFDPTFTNVPIARLTDATDSAGDEYPDYSYWGSFNLHEKLIILLTASGSGTSFIEWNPDLFTTAGGTLSLTRYDVPGLNGRYVEGTWSGVNPDWMYAPAKAGGGPKIYRLDMTNRSSPTETAFDFSGKTVGGQTVLASDYFAQMLMASDEDTFSVSWFDSGYNPKGIVVGRLSTLGLVFALADTTVDECNVSRDGLYLHVTWGPPGQSGTGYRNLEVKLSDGTSSGFVDNTTDLSVGHHVPYGSGNGLLGYQDTVNKLVSYNLSSPATKTTIFDYGSNFSLGDIHLSTTAVDQTYALVSEEQKTTDATNLPLVGEYGLVKLDGSGTWIRVARHYSLQPSGGDYYSQTRANLSPSRRFIIGSSNMGSTSGRKDAYVWYIGGAVAWTDFVPSTYSLTAVTAASQSTVYTSNTITVAGLGAADSSFVRITGGTYSKNGGAYTAAAGTVVNGDTIAVRVTSAASAGAAITAQLNIGGVFGSYVVTTAVSAPVNTVAPAISGSAVQGQVLTVSNGTWSNVPTSYAYQWNRAGSAISGATASTYTCVAGDVGSTLTCTVTATNAGGSASATSSATAAVTAPSTTTAFDPTKLGSSYVTLSNANLTATATSSSDFKMRARSAGTLASGSLYYFEVTPAKVSGGHVNFGIGPATYSMTGTTAPENTTGCFLIQNASSLYNGTAYVGDVDNGYAAGDVYGFAVNLSTGKLWARRIRSGAAARGWNNNTSTAAQNPVGSVGGFDISSISGSAAMIIASFTTTNDACTLNTGNTVFALTAPTGYGKVT